MKTGIFRAFERKGISPLIATVLLIAFTLAVGGVLLTWMTRYSRDLGSDVDKSKRETMDCMSVRPSIQRVVINSTNGVISADVANVGSSKLVLKTVTAYNSTGDRCVMKINITNLEAGSMTVADNTSCGIFNSDCSNFGEVRATTSCGEKYHVYTSTPTCT